MKDKDTLTIYWTASGYNPEAFSRTMLYAEPEHVFNALRRQKVSDSGPKTIFSCPATASSLKNVYAVYNQVSFQANIPENIDEYRAMFDNLDTTCIVDAYKPRPSSIENYDDLTMDLSWNFVADEPLIAKFTAPYFPAHTPAPGAILTAGEFDIGSWYRPYHLNYFLPKTSRTMVFNEGDPLFYVEFMTNKKIVFKRYINSTVLKKIEEEISTSPSDYSSFKTLKERYLTAKRTKVMEQVRFLINKNLVE